MAEIIELLLFLSLLFTMNQSALAAPIDKRIIKRSDIEETMRNLEVKLNSLEQEMANLTDVIDLKIQDIDDVIDGHIKNAIAPLKIQIKFLMEKVNQSTSSTMATPKSDNITPSPSNGANTMSSSNVTITPSPSDDTNTTSSSNVTITPSPSNGANTTSSSNVTITPPPSNGANTTSSSDDTNTATPSDDTNTISSSNIVSTTSLSSNSVDDVSTQSSNTLLGIVITIITVLMIGLLLYIAYQYRYQIRSWILSNEEQVQCISSAENDETILPQNIRGKGNKKYQRLYNDHND